MQTFVHQIQMGLRTMHKKINITMCSTCGSSHWACNSPPYNMASPYACMITQKQNWNLISRNFIRALIVLRVEQSKKFSFSDFYFDTKNVLLAWLKQIGVKKRITYSSK